MDGQANPVRCRATLVDGRLARPDLLVIGATSRDAGKTELVCRLIRRHATSSTVVGLKITTVDGTHDHCPHGGDGCGVCTSLDRPWVVSREHDHESPKDSCRMLASGAHRVYWLRVLRSELAGGAGDVMARLPAGSVGVCESTSLRHVVEPGLFLLVRTARNSRAKPSARAVAHLAERVVVSDGRSFDLDLDRISVVDGQWALRREAYAFVVEGADGRSRADRDAALRRTRTSLEAQFDRVFIGPETTPRGGVSPVTPDASPDPAGGWCLVTPPAAGGVPPGLVNAMFRRRTEVDAVVAVTRPDDRHVGLVICRPGLVQDVITAVAKGRRAIAALGDRWAVRELHHDQPGSGGGFDRLPASARLASASVSAKRRGAEAP